MTHQELPNYGLPEYDLPNYELPNYKLPDYKQIYYYNLNKFKLSALWYLVKEAGHACCLSVLLMNLSKINL